MYRSLHKLQYAHNFEVNQSVSQQFFLEPSIMTMSLSQMICRPTDQASSSYTRSRLDAHQRRTLMRQVLASNRTISSFAPHGEGQQRRSSFDVDLNTTHSSVTLRALESACDIADEVMSLLQHYDDSEDE